MNEAGRGVDRPHEHDEEGVEFDQQGADSVSSLRQAERPMEAVPGPQRPNYPQQQRAAQSAQYISGPRRRRSSPDR
jgi:hypothetical protein